MRFLPAALLCVAAAAAPARADEPVATYALVIGSNAGGPGQQELRFAEDDARKVGQVLTDLGGYRADTVDIVVHPTPALVRDRLAKIGQRVAADLAAGRQARLFFYYSGHARSNAIDLGTEELPLEELRARLFAVPATLTVVVLDACQSGAFSRIKGAAPAADFSYSSRQRLDASGIAVLASSSGSELSQESEQLHGSYFTHHLLVGLRGAGDANHDGQVSIDEAYRYAYQQTLLATAETAVGGQHVSLEVDLKGHGEVPLSFPRAATAAIELPAALEGQTLVEDRRAHAVVAETYKAKGAAVRIAVAPGDYDVLVRHGDRLSRCSVSTGGNGVEVDLGACRDEQIVVATRKGGGVVAWAHPYRLEVTTTLGGERADGFTQTLGNFGYKQDSLALGSGISVGGLTHVSSDIWLGGIAGYASSPRWQRDEMGSSTGLAPLRFDMATTTLAALALGELPIYRVGQGARLAVYGRLALGLGIGRTSFIDQDDKTTKQTFYGAAGSVGAGLRIDTPAGLGVALGYQLDYAPVIANLTGDTHASGGHRLALGVAYSFSTF